MPRLLVPVEGEPHAPHDITGAGERDVAHLTIPIRFPWIEEPVCDRARAYVRETSLLAVLPGVTLGLAGVTGQRWPVGHFITTLGESA